MMMMNVVHATDRCHCNQKIWSSNCELRTFTMSCSCSSNVQKLFATANLLQTHTWKPTTPPCRHPSEQTHCK